MTKGEAKKADFYFEFGGPAGTAANVVCLPVLVQLLAHWSKVGHVDLSWTSSFAEKPFWRAIYESEVLCTSCTDHTVLGTCLEILLGWFLWFVLLERCLPGQVVLGAPIHGNPDHRLSYKLNAHLSFWLTLTALYAGWPYWHAESQTIQFTAAPLIVLYENFGSLAVVSSVLCYLLSVYLYISSFRPNKTLSKPGTSGYQIYDFWMGRELNPRWGSFDWKVFCELRPGLVGWMVLNLAALQEQYNRLGYVTGSMILLNIAQGMYVWDAQFQERAILTTMDITTDGFGFMLVFGGMSLVPRTNSPLSLCRSSSHPFANSRSHMGSFYLCPASAIPQSSRSSFVGADVGGHCRALFGWLYDFPRRQLPKGCLSTYPRKVCSHEVLANQARHKTALVRLLGLG